MLPQFPDFKKLEITDKLETEKITSQYPPYSDFNFISLWDYDIHKLAEISTLNNNLILKFTDYITNKPFYTFIGKYSPKETIDELLKLARKNNLENCLKLIPEDNIKNDIDSLRNYYQIDEDRDNFDYIYSIQDWAELSWSKFHTKRHESTHFISTYQNSKFTKLDLSNEKIQQQINNLFLVWSKQKKSSQDTENELNAIKNLFIAAKHYNYLALGVYIEENLIAFSVCELLPDKYAMSHFGKVDYSYKGLFSYLKHMTATELFNLDYKYLNLQQDMGIEGLRSSKEMWHPVGFLKKYIITPNE